MRALAIPALVTLLLLTGQATASAGAKPEREPGTSVEMPYLIAPVIVDGGLYANAYVTSKIDAVSPGATIVVRDKLPFIQDAYVRDVNATPIGTASDPKVVDVLALAARLTADAKRIVGSSLIDSVEIIRVQMSPLRADTHS